jgi:hypothetical protein
MATIKPVEEVSQDFTADLTALRDDVAKLTSSVSEFMRIESATTTSTDNARQKISGTDLATTIEHKPMVAALIAMVAGMLVGLLSRGRK